MHTNLSENEQRVLVLLADRAVNRVGIDKTVPKVPRDALQALVAKGLVNDWSADDPLVTLTRAGGAEVTRLRDAGILPWPIGANETRKLMGDTLVVVVIRDPGDDCWRIKECQQDLVWPNSGSSKVPPSVWEKRFPSKELAFQYFEEQVTDVNRRG